MRINYFPKENPIGPPARATSTVGLITEITQTQSLNLVVHIVKPYLFDKPSQLTSSQAFGFSGNPLSSKTKTQLKTCVLRLLYRSNTQISAIHHFKGFLNRSVSKNEQTKQGLINQIRVSFQFRTATSKAELIDQCLLIFRFPLRRGNCG